MKKPNQIGISIFLLFVSMISIQCGASVAKQLFPQVGALGTTALRVTFASIMLGIVWRPWRGPLSQKAIRTVFLYGISLGFMNLLFYLALERIPLGIAVALEFTGPLAVAFFSSRRALDLLWAFFATLGIFLILPVAKSAQALDSLGVVLALGAGVCWAFYILAGHKAGHQMHEGRAAALGMFVASLLVAPFGIASAGTKLISLDILPFAIVIAVFSSALPYTLEMFALKKLPTQTFGILMSIEPVIAALAGLAFLNEHLTALQWSAIACIMIASLGSSIVANKTINEVNEKSINPTTS